MMSDELKTLAKDEQLILQKLETIEECLSNHVITEIKKNRKLITGLKKEVGLIRGSLGANTEGFRALNDRVHSLIEQLINAKIIG